jgi:hypothetical protein
MNLRDQELCEYLLSVNEAKDEVAAYKNISIELLPSMREYFKSQGKKIRVRYRGPRTNSLDHRTRSQRMQDCVKQFANRFSIYFVA